MFVLRDRLKPASELKSV